MPARPDADPSPKSMKIRGYQGKIAQKMETIVGEKKFSAPSSFLLIYPNSYYLGMSSLGFQSILARVDALPGWYSERAFLGAERSLEKSRTFSSFDVVAFSISYEMDYLNLPRIFSQGRLPLKAGERDERHPLVIAGGMAVTINPEPVADFFDLIVLGESEGTLEKILSLIEQYPSTSRRDLLTEMAALPGAYVPRFYVPRFDRDGRPADVTVENHHPAAIKINRAISLADSPTASLYLTSQTVFPNRGLLEISRGCPWHCRFCAVGYLLRPPRNRSLPSVLSLARSLGRGTRSLGLIASSVGDHPAIDQILSSLETAGFSISISSLRPKPDCDRLIEFLARSGQRTLTLAPEAGSRSLRKRLNKDIPEEAFASVLQKARQAGFRRAKLYFLTGLPGETDQDVAEIVQFCRRLVARLPLTVSISPFVPKPHTPLQWSALDGLGSLKNKLRYLRAELGKIGGIKIISGSAREAVLQACLSRGDRRMGAVIEEPNGPEAERLSRPFQERKRGEFLPWAFVDSGVRETRLWEEYQEAFRDGTFSPG